MEVSMTNGCLLLPPPRPLKEASAELAERLPPSRGSCAGVVEAP